MQTPEEYLAQQQNPSQMVTPDEYLAKQSTSMQTPEEYLANQDNKEEPILPNKTQVTQDFGTVNPIEPTAGHKAGDTNFAAQANTPVKLPKGSWYVVSAFNGANPNGAPGDYTNEGYGNDVIVQNTQTGEKLHFLHLSSANLQPGQIAKGGTIAGMTGDSGNSTGPNLGVEYYNAKGELNDVLASPYAQAFMIQ